MLAGETKSPFSNTEWVFEIKWDGYRAVADCTGKQSQLYSRNALSFIDDYPLVFEEIKKITTPMVLDGEIVVLNKEGKPDFQKLQLYAGEPDLPIVYYVFDILYYKGKEVTRQTLLERKMLLRKVLPESDVIRYCDHVEDDGEAFFAIMREQNMEGMIAKKKSSLYLPGERSKNWLKIKHQQIDEFVIAGFTKPEGSRVYFGSLILGQYRDGVLTYAGHTGTGFNQKALQDLHERMLPLVTGKSPFQTKVPVNNTATWIRPKLVANIHYSELTQNGILRHPVFHGLRVDKTISDMKTTAKSNKKTSEKVVAGKENGDDKNTITVDKIRLPLSNIEKVFWPDEGYTKGDVIMYYNEVSHYLLPYLKNRPQSMRRTPNGITDNGFFQKDVGQSAPAWAKTISLHSESANKDIDYLLCNNNATLLYMANLGCIELNPWNSTIKKPDNPDYVILDLDPSDKNSFDDVIETAIIVKELLDKAGADSYCKTSGVSGLHIYVPMGARYSYDEARMFAQIVAELAVKKAPELATTERTIANRKSKLYIDYMQNKRGQTLASVYSIRPKPGATVSAPLDWKEVKKGLHPSLFTIKNMMARIIKKGDLFRPVLGKGINLSAAIKRLEKL